MNLTGFSLHMIHISIATSANKPGIPNKPDTAEVIKLIGTCMSNWFPSVFRKNNNRAPINNLTNVVPINRRGFIGAPLLRSKSIRTPRIVTIKIGST